MGDGDGTRVRLSAAERRKQRAEADAEAAVVAAAEAAAAASAVAAEPAGRRPAAGARKSRYPEIRPRMKRTISLDAAAVVSLDLYCASVRRNVSDVVQEAVVAYLEAKGVKLVSEQEALLSGGGAGG